MVKKGLKYLLAILLLLAFLFIIIGYYFLSTNHGLKKAISLINQYSGYTVSAESIEGNLLNRTQLTKIHVKGKHLEFSGESVVLDWQSSALWDKKLIVESVAIDNAMIMLAPSSNSSQPTSKQPINLQDIDLPIDIKIKDFLVTQLVIKKPVPSNKSSSTKNQLEKGDILIEKFHLGIDYEQQKVLIHTFEFKGLDTQLNLKGELLTKGKFPLYLQSATDYKYTDYQQNIDTTIKGELKDSLVIDVKGQGLSDFQLMATLSSLLKKPILDAKLSLQKFDDHAFGLVNTELSATLALKGQFGEQVKLAGEVLYNSPETDQLKLTVNAHLDEHDLKLSSIILDFIPLKEKFKGSGSYSLSNQKIDLHLQSEQLHWPQTKENNFVSLADTKAAITGYLNNYQIDAQTHGNVSTIGDVSLNTSIQGNLTKLDKANVMIKTLGGEVVINASGEITPINLTANLTSKDLNLQKIAPELVGKISHHLQLDAKEIDGNLTANLLIKELKGHLQHQPISGNGAIHFDGQQKHLAFEKFFLNLAGNTVSANGKLSLTEQQKESNLKAEIKANYLNRLSPNVSGVLRADLTAEGTLPSPKINANIYGTNLAYRGLDATISPHLSLNAKTKNKQLFAEATLKKLSGRLHKKPITGKGKVTFDQSQNTISIHQLLLNLAGNTINAKGMLNLDNQAKDNQLSAQINAPFLKYLLPDLGGSVKANLSLKGQLNAPSIDSSIQGESLHYKDQHIQYIDASANLNLAKNSLRGQVELKELFNEKERIESATLALNGLLDKHTFSAHLLPNKQSIIPALNLIGSGSFNRQTMAWVGKLNTLDIFNDKLGKWTMSHSTPLVLSKNNLSIKQFCLQQLPSQICTNADLTKGMGTIVLNLNKLQTQKFNHFLPKTVHIDSELSGKAQLNVKKSTINAQGQFETQDGQLKVNTGQGVLTTQIKQFNAAFNLKNNRLTSLVKGHLSKIGNIEIQAELPSIKQKNIMASVKIDSPNLKFIEEITPQISDIDGRLKGNITLSGNPNKTLKIAGKIQLEKTDFNIPQFGSEIRDMTLEIFAKDQNQFGFKGAAKAGTGDFFIDGEIDPATQRGNINLKGKNFQIANSNKLKVQISPDIQLLFAEHIQLRGEIVIPKALIIPESTASKIMVSEDVILPQQTEKKKPANSPVDVELMIKLGNNVRVASADIETRLNGSLMVNAKPGKAPQATGAISVKTGELRIYGQMLTIERGRIIFSNGPIENPSLDIRTKREIESEEVTVGANILGTVKSPEISLFSTPSMADATILSYLLFGRPPNSDSFSTMALLQTGGIVGANTLARDVRSSLGLDVLDISLTGIEAGKNLSKKLYVGMKSNFFDAINQFLADYRISSRTHIESAISANEISVDLIKVIRSD